ncbi:E3 ubiquitin-protein ligase ATL76 [Morus notabilis]|uniref:E3 ubiquitin-protein ligase ATL76 n=1 Tax=Morus notabilis TaxID=981085 RepID=W9QYW3_9ROSA|nr:E3 ubiquitin-protein ligase ATL76 [Morus notabilis]
MFSQTSIPSFPSSQYTLTLDFLATLILCVTIAFCFVLLYHILFSLLSWLQDMRSNHNILEQTQIIDSNMSHQVHFYRSLVQYNAQLIDMLERFVRDIDERRGQRLRESNRLPPLISYGSRERRSSYGGGDECVICLEDLEDGESCQVWPVCNHIFHTNCIDHWLKNRHTCPVCRNCLLDV